MRGFGSHRIPCPTEEKCTSRNVLVEKLFFDKKPLYQPFTTYQDIVDQSNEIDQNYNQRVDNEYTATRIETSRDTVDRDFRKKYKELDLISETLKSKSNQDSDISEIGKKSLKEQTTVVSGNLPIKSDNPLEDKLDALGLIDIMEEKFKKGQFIDKLI